MKKSQAAHRVLHFLPLLIVLGGYVRLIFAKYWMLPVTSDGLDFCFRSAYTWKDIRLFERYFNFYLSKIITLPFNNLLHGYSFASLLYHVGIIIFAYLIARRLAGKVQGLLAAILTSLCPFLVGWATEYFSDAPCLFFGLAAFYFSLKGNGYSKNHIKYFLCGFLLAASLFSKFFGVIFIIPVLINIWPYRSLKNFCFFGQGILGVILFIAACDRYWLNDFLYHLNPKNYLAYIDNIGNAMFVYQSPGYGELLFAYLGKRELIFYFIIFIVFVIQGVRFLEYREKFDWKRKGSFSLALVGLSLGIIFTIINLLKPDWYLQYHYNYCIFIPWIIAFCSVLGFIGEVESKKTTVSKSEIASGCLSVFFIIALFTTGELSSSYLLNSSFGRLFCVAYIWIHVFTIALVLGAGNYLRNNGYRKITTFLFLIGCFVIIWHNAFWAHDLPEYKKELHTETKAFLEKYRELSKSAPVISCDLSVPRGDEIMKTLFLSRLAGVEILDSYKSKDLGEILKTKPVPFYVLTKSGNHENLKKEADSTGLRVIEIQDDVYFGCAFFKIVSSEKPLKE